MTEQTMHATTHKISSHDRHKHLHFSGVSGDAKPVQNNLVCTFFPVFHLAIDVDTAVYYSCL